MKALVFPVHRTPLLTELDGWDGITAAIGGYVGLLRLETDIHLWYDDDGIPKGLEPNLWAVGPDYLGAPIYGVAVIARMRVDTEGDEHFFDLPPAVVARYMRLGRVMPPGGLCLCGGPDDGHYPECQPPPWGTR